MSSLSLAQNSHSSLCFNPLRANNWHTWHMENHPFLWRRIRRVRRIQVCMARKGLMIGNPFCVLSIAKNFALFILPLSASDGPTTARRIKNNWLNVWLYSVLRLPIKKRNQLKHQPSEIEKEIACEVAWVDHKHFLRKSADRKAQISKPFVPLTKLVCALQILSGCVYHLEQPQAQSLFSISDGFGS